MEERRPLLNTNNKTLQVIWRLISWPPCNHITPRHHQPHIDNPSITQSSIRCDNRKKWWQTTRISNFQESSQWQRAWRALKEGEGNSSLLLVLLGTFLYLVGFLGILSLMIFGREGMPYQLLAFLLGEHHSSTGDDSTPEEFWSSYCNIRQICQIYLYGAKLGILYISVLVIKG